MYIHNPLWETIDKQSKKLWEGPFLENDFFSFSSVSNSWLVGSFDYYNKQKKNNNKKLYLLPRV